MCTVVKLEYSIACASRSAVPASASFAPTWLSNCWANWRSASVSTLATVFPSVWLPDPTNLPPWDGPGRPPRSRHDTEESSVMPTVFELDQVTVRARTESAVLRSREYDLLDPSGVAVASATQDAGSPPTMARRWLATSAKANMSTDFDLRDP